MIIESFSRIRGRTSRTSRRGYIFPGSGSAGSKKKQCRTGREGKGSKQQTAGMTVQGHATGSAENQRALITGLAVCRLKGGAKRTNESIESD
jgi:hypothetical protein